MNPKPSKKKINPRDFSKISLTRRHIELGLGIPSPKYFRESMKSGLGHYNLSPILVIDFSRTPCGSFNILY